MLRALIDFMLPRECHVCGVHLQGDEKYLCTVCKSKLPYTHYHHYRDGDDKKMNPMESRLAGIVPFEYATASFFYQHGSSFSSLVQDLKYRGFPGLGRELGRLAGQEFFSAGILSDVELLLPVPMHWRKQAGRGYNQTIHIARGISDVSGVAVGNQLRAIRAHSTQTRLDSEGRRRNLQGVFKVSNPETLPDHIAIIDDICTTGATLVAAAEAVLATRADIKLTFLTLAVTVG